MRALLNALVFAVQVRSILLGRVALAWLGSLFARPTRPAPPASPPPPPAPPGPDALLAELVAAHNRFRTVRGLRPLARSGRLDAAAQRQATTMAGTRTLDHEAGGTTLAGRLRDAGVTYAAAGENIATGYATVAAVVQGWADSPSHRENMLATQFNQIGVGLAYTRNSFPYWCVVFAGMRPRYVTTVRREDESCPDGVAPADREEAS